MTIAHIFLDFIPSCFLGSPGPSNVLAVMPAHRLLLKGRGYEAIKLSVLGCTIGLLLVIILAVPIYYITRLAYPMINEYIAYILIAASLIMIIKEKDSRLSAFFVFSLSGILGVTVLTMPNLNQPLMPLLSGLFGSSMLILSINQSTVMPKQDLISAKIRKKEAAKAVLSGMAASVLTAFLPGISSSESAFLATSFFKKIKLKTYLILLGSISSIVAILSFIAAFSIGRLRSGSIAAIQAIAQNLTPAHLILIILISILSSIPSIILTLFIAKRFSAIITKLSYRKICISILALITAIVIIISGPLGLLVFAISTALGILPSLLHIRHSHLMGCLVMPIIAFLLL